MEKLRDTDYYLGLDCGTSSVGFAVTDSDYNILKFNGKAMWGSHIFDEANTAEERRVQRGTRRRLERRKKRVCWLQELFAEEIYKIDPTFFIRLNDSMYLLEDKNISDKNILFNDVDFTDKDYMERYPTIFHLRKALREDKISDPRLLYLGIQHIIKHRGHFLFPGENLKAVTDISPLIDKLQSLLIDLFEIDEISIDETIESALQENKKSERQKKLEKQIDISDSSLKKNIIKILVGYKVQVQNLFGKENYSEVPAIEFKKAGFEDGDLPQLEDQLEPEEFELIEVLLALYNWSILASILPSESHGIEPYISNAKVNLYDSNKNDLKRLKAVIKKYCPEEYNKFFHGIKDKPGVFTSYIGKNHDSHPNKEFRAKRINIDEFYKNVRVILSKMPKEDEDVQFILSEIENDSFLPLLISSKNSVIPYQINKIELEAILDTASKTFPFLLGRDEDGITIKEKIILLFRFRVPYYVGPFGKNTENSNSIHWLERLESGRITPWNFEKKVDLGLSAENFIVRMTNKCTYCKDQDVLPKNSILYSKFLVLNELNNLRIKGSKFSVEQKQEIFNGLFRNTKKVTIKKMIDFMVNEGWYSKGEITKEDISGIDDDFKSSFSAYIDFKDYIESKRLKESEVDLIIKWITIFSEGGDILKKRITDSFGEKLNESEIGRISQLKYSGWGRFSHKYLCELKTKDVFTGEEKSLISMMWDTQFNQMELMSSQFSFREKVDLIKPIGKLDYSVVDDLYVSPSVKKQIWQTLRIVDEIESVMHHPPKKVFIEVTRSEGEKKRTTSRKKDLMDKLKKATKSGLGFDIDVEELTTALEGKDESQISRQDKLFLYFSQCGKCMYSGERIELENLYNTNIYDIDHIYPKSKSNDDSLANKVLVKKETNARKSNVYPIDDSIRVEMHSFWKMLLDKEFIPKEKYNRLIRSTPLMDEDLKGFINRQLVETSQSTKATAEILKAYFGNKTDIVYSKARNVSDFRNDYGFVKCRIINQLHHAKDAFLNIVVGNVYHTKYTSEFYKRLSGEGYGDLSKTFEYNVPGAWIVGKDGTISSVKKTMSKNNILLTFQPEESKGALFDLQLVKKGSNKGALPSKTSDKHIKAMLSKGIPIDEVYENWTNKYGGYNRLTTCYFSLVEVQEKKGRFAVFIPISIIDSKNIITNKDLMEYCKERLGLEVKNIIKERVLINTVFVIDGFPMRLKAKDSVGKKILMNSVVQLILSEESQLVLHKIENFKKRSKVYKDLTINPEKDGINEGNTLLVFEELVKKCCTPIYKKRPNNQEKVLISENALNEFKKSNLETKCEILLQMVNYLGNKNGKADFSVLGGASNAGVTTISSKINLEKNFLVIVNQSITGLFESEEVIS